MTRNVTPQVPGESVVAEEKKQAVEAVAEETVTVSKASLDALLARVSALEAQPTKAARKPVGAKLPDQDSIDPEQIKTPALSEQGWVVPTQFGANPNVQKGL